MLAILGFQFKMQIKLPSPVVRTGNGQGQKVVKVVNNFKNEGGERESPEWKYLVPEFQRSISWSGETTVADMCHAIWKGSPPTPATKREKQESWGHMGTMLAITQAEECLASRRPFLMLATISSLKEAIFDDDNHFKGKDEDLMHTQKHVNVLSATKISKKPGVWMSEEWSTVRNNLVPQGQWNRPYRSQRTVKIKLVPQGQSDRPHWSKRTAGIKIVPQGQWNRPYWSQRTAKIKFVPQGQRNRPYWSKRTVKKKQNRASGSKRSTPPKEAHCKK